MVSFKKVNTFANRGQKSETAAMKFLDAWQKALPRQREFSRLVDTKAAGRVVKAAASDFEFFTLGSGLSVHGLLEVKETEHLYRLERDKVPQLARLRKRANCGGLCLVAVRHSIPNQWRVVTAHYLATTGDKGSWNLADLPTFDSIELALQTLYPEVFR